ncbi:MAG TPA: nitronate monooxygenase [Propionibacterium sp.]|nr:nitronate monooxygenase [Propionibacterium sp.]
MPNPNPLPSPLDRLRVPVVAAPMFLVSTPDLVVACCRAGVVGSFPALNLRTTQDLDAWCSAIEDRLEPDDAPWAVNLIVHSSNARIRDDLAVLARHRAPIVITSLGAVTEVVDAVHAWGGLVLHDVTNLKHARKAAEAGVDGLILVSAGAGGHAGTVSPFALMAEVRPWFDGLVLLAGGLSTGADVAAARAMGADLAYLGTRFIATAESGASEAYKAMLVEAGSGDIVHTPSVSTIPANFLRASLEAAGYDLTASPDVDLAHLTAPTDADAKAWRDIWSAGHGVAAIHDLPTVGELVARLAAEYEDARARL